MTSGVTVNIECVKEFEKLKLKHAYRYILYRLSDDFKTIIIEKKAPSSCTYEDFLSDLPSDHPRYAVFDLHYTLNDGSVRDKPFFVLWAPDICKTKEKMVIASSKDALRKKLDGVQHEVQAADFDDLDIEEITLRISLAGTK